MEGLVVNGDGFFFGDFAEMADNLFHADPSEVESLHSRQDGGQNFVWFGGGEDEDRVWRRFLEGF